MERREKLHKIIDELDESVQLFAHSLVDRLIYLEERLFELEKLPFIKVHPNDPTKQKELPARKQYIPLLQQYNLTIKTICKLIGIETEQEDTKISEFKKYLQDLQSKLYGGS